MEGPQTGVPEEGVLGAAAQELDTGGVAGVGCGKFVRVGLVLGI